MLVLYFTTRYQLIILAFWTHALPFNLFSLKTSPLPSGPYYYSFNFNGSSNPWAAGLTAPKENATEQVEQWNNLKKRWHRTQCFKICTLFTLSNNPGLWKYNTHFKDETFISWSSTSIMHTASSYLRRALPPWGPCTTKTHFCVVPALASPPGIHQFECT